MELIKADNLAFNTGSKDIIKDGCFRIMAGEKSGLIGANGSGKTTLLRLILGEIEPDRGSIIRKKGLSAAYVPQQPEYAINQSIEDFLSSELTEMMELMAAAAEEMSAGSPNEMKRLMNSYQECCDRFDEAGGYDAIERSENYLRRLGLDNPMNQSMGTLSGGERSLVFFAKALLSNPELLILDEPGNHLDYLGLAWLESFLSGFKGAVLIVSHNRYLIDSTCETIMDLEGGILTSFTGNYTNYRIIKYKSALKEQSEWEASRRLIEKLEKKVRELQSIAMSQYNPPASIMAQLGAAKAKLAEEKSRGLEKPRIAEDDLKIDFGNEFSRSKIALRIKNFDLRFGERVLFKNAELEISCGEKVALVGANGSGKTSLINAVLNQGEWHNKSLQIGPSQKIGYLSQTAVFCKTAVTVEDEIRSWGAMTRDGAIGLAGNFSFSYNDLEKPLNVLSGGEVNRLQLARLMYQQINFLVLDEPTNHMDISSREMIEQAVLRFNGTVLVISHDRYFLDQLVERVVEIDTTRLVSHEGNFSEYFKAKYPVLPRLSGEVGKRGIERRTCGVLSSESMEAIENRIEQYESEKLQLERELRESFSARDQKGGLKIAVRLEKLSAILDKLYNDWESASK